MLLLRYFGNLPASRIILWCFVMWWLVMVAIYYVPDPGLWATSLGIGLFVGYALMLSTGPVTLARFRQRFWESMRLFICPFMVSSFSGLIAGKDFVMFFSPHWLENAAALAAVAGFLLLCGLLRMMRPGGER